LADSPVSGVVKFVRTRPALIATGAAALVLAYTVYPGRWEETPAVDPAARAEEAYRTLLAQIDTASGDAGAVVVPPMSPQAIVAGVRGALDRDLFAARVERKKKPAGTPSSRPARATRPVAPPELQGVFLVGRSRQAMLGGELVVPGDKIGGFVVREIRPDRVILVKGKKTFELTIKEK